MLLLFLNFSMRLSCQKQAAVIHCWGHQWRSPISFYIADHEAKRQATSISPVFTTAQIDEPNICTLLSYLHSLFHPSAKVLKAFLQNFIELTKDDMTYLNSLTQTCTICQRTNPNTNMPESSSRDSTWRDERCWQWGSLSVFFWTASLF